MGHLRNPILLRKESSITVMAIFTKASLIKGAVMEAAFITFSGKGDTREIGLMVNMMGMGLKVGQKEVDIEGNIVMEFDMELEFISSSMAIVMLVNGLMDKAMVEEFKVVLMEVTMLVNLKLV